MRCQPSSFLVCVHVSFCLLAVLSVGERDLCLCMWEKTCLDVQAEARGFYMRETDRESGSIPEGIQAASMLCDQDRDDFIRPVSFSLPPPPSVFAFP